MDEVIKRRSLRRRLSPEKNRQVTELLYILSDQSLPNLVRVLLEIGASADAYELYAAITNDHEAAVRLLLRRGVDKTALTLVTLNCAIQQQNDSIVVQFLDLGVDQFEVDSSGWTALSFATALNAEAIVKLLLERPGADRILMIRDIESSFFYAKQKENDSILQLLEEAKARLSEPVVSQTIIHNESSRAIRYMYSIKHLALEFSTLDNSYIT
ncbi:hypothetical protein BGZ57DRAFT_987781 [Hyaloscypha finlandica]|nr:hypothetical protein BGZ57DRAFT_987781 [Hyaloscypha finlandica]